MTLIYSSEYNFYALCKVGNLYATGLNRYGELGTGDNDNRSRLTLMPGLSEGVTARQAVCGWSHTVVIGTDGLCYATGLNGHGQLGTGDNTDKYELTLMPGLSEGVTARQAVCGWSHTVVIGSNDLCYATGSNRHGQLGTGNNTDQYELTRMRGLPGGVTARQVVCGRLHTVVIGTDGLCYATGMNNRGQLGTRDNINRDQLTPMLGLPKNFIALHAVCGFGHTVVLGTNGLCYATGWNVHGQLGTGDNVNRNQLTLMPGLPKNVTALQVVCSDSHTVVRGNDGCCYATGQNYYGQLGTGNNVNKYQLTPMQGLTGGVTALQVVSGACHTVVIGSNGLCYATGWNREGQLGTCDNVNKNILTPMLGLPKDFIALHAVCGWSHTVVLGTNGCCYATGMNYYGQLGTDDNVDKNILTLMKGLPIIQEETKMHKLTAPTLPLISSPIFTPLNQSQLGKLLQHEQDQAEALIKTNPSFLLSKGTVTDYSGRTFTNITPFQICIGDNSFYFLYRGRVYATGWNKYGQLGTRDNDNKTQLTPMEGLTGGVTARQVVSGDYHTVVIGTDGLCYATGWNKYGQLGTRDNTDKYELTPMRGLPLDVTALQVVCGNCHTVVIGIDGLCYATGLNEYGQLGTRDKTDKYELTPMRGLPPDVTARQVVCGRLHTVVIGTDGLCYATGLNEYGQLGTGDNTDKYELTLMPGLSEGVIALQVVCSDSHTVVIGSNDLCYATGSNQHGQLGTRDKTDKYELTPMRGLPPDVTARQVVCGRLHTVVIGTDGLCYATGLNRHGQLGTGDNTDKYELTPMRGLLLDVTALQVVCGNCHTVVIGSNGCCYATGLNSHGQLGMGDKAYTNQLTLMEGLTGGVTALQVVCSDSHTVVRGNDGCCYATGFNIHGQLGTRDKADKIRLTLMQGLPIIQEETKMYKPTAPTLPLIPSPILTAPNQSQLGKLLQHVAYGEQDQAEALIKTNPSPSLLLGKGTVTDYSGRTFTNITPFQLALWSYDWHMWTMLKKYLSQPAARDQLRELEAFGTTHGKHYDFEPLLSAYKTYVDKYDAWYATTNWTQIGTYLSTSVDKYDAWYATSNWTQIGTYLSTSIGRAQTQVPAHVAQEYCRPDHSFDPTPSFKEPSLPRSFKIGDDSREVWFPLAAQPYGSLGGSFWVFRGNLGGARRVAGVMVPCISLAGVKRDFSAVAELCKIRTLQYEKLKEHL